MIKVNLSAAPKQLDISNVGGFDFSGVKPILVMVAIAAVYAPDWTLYPMWEESISARQGELRVEEGKLAQLRRSMAELDKEAKQINELKIQEENLGKKLTAVKSAVSEKKNPSNILLYIAKNIPPELHIKELFIEKETMIISGEALNYTSVGNFVTTLRSSIFIKDANIISSTASTRPSDKRRIEAFEVKFVIARYE